MRTPMPAMGRRLPLPGAHLELAAKEVPDKLIFGADGPDGDSRVELYKIRLLKLPPDLERKVLGGTVERLVPA